METVMDTGREGRGRGRERRMPKQKRQTWSMAELKIISTLAFSVSVLKSSLDIARASASTSFFEKLNTMTGSKFLL